MTCARWVDAIILVNNTDDNLHSMSLIKISKLTINKLNFLKCKLLWNVLVMIESQVYCTILTILVGWNGEWRYPITILQVIDRFLTEDYVGRMVIAANSKLLGRIEPRLRTFFMFNSYFEQIDCFSLFYKVIHL